jgi:hypothetical protein
MTSDRRFGCNIGANYTPVNEMAVQRSTRRMRFLPPRAVTKQRNGSSAHSSECHQFAASISRFASVK